jgi:inosose dehydratase
VLTSRRRFLGTTATLASAPLFASARAIAKATPARAREEHRSWLPFGIQSYSLRAFDAQGALQRSRELGLKHVEFFPGHLPPDSSDADLWAFQKTCRQHDISMSAYGVVGFSKDHAANERFFVLANKLGIRNLSADPDPDSFDSLDKLVAEYGIRIAIHNHGPNHRYDTIDDVAQAVDGHHPWVGACVDTGHFIRSAQDPAEAITRLGARVFGVHLKDFDAPKGDAKGTTLGVGQLDVPATMRAIAAVGFPSDGALSLEYEENPQEPMADLRRCIEVAHAAAAEISAH